MTSLFLFVLAVAAIPLAIVVFTVIATESEKRVYRSAPVSRSLSALVFGIAALAGVAIVLRGTGPEYISAMALALSIPGIVIAAALAVASHRLLVNRSKWIAAVSGIGVAFLTVLISSAFFAAVIAPDLDTAMLVVSFGAVLVLLPHSVAVLPVGALAGVLLSYLSNHRQTDKPLDPETPTNYPPSG
jgi:hypothetical protein